MLEVTALAPYSSKHALLGAYAAYLWQIDRQTNQSTEGTVFVDGEWETRQQRLELHLITAKQLIRYNPGVYRGGWYIPGFGRSTERERKMNHV